MKVLQRLDDGLALPDHERMLLDAVRRLARDRFQARAARYDESSEFPWENIKDLNQLEAYLACCREISAACAATGIIWATNFHAATPIIDFATEEQKQRWLTRLAAGGLAALALTEPGAGSDATAMTTTFRQDGDRIVVDGAKIFITNGDVADLLVVFGKWSELGAGRNAISIAIIEKGTPGLEVLRIENKMGIRASSTAALAFDNCRIPCGNLLGAPGSGLRMLFSFLNKSRPSVAAHALGIARAAFEDAVAYVNQRTQFGKRIVEMQGIQFMLADHATDLVLCERWLWHVAYRIEAGEKDLASEASMLK
ncbi:MAG: acyl-CoA dehydrogenase family protein, partial [Betaproteobacteria bacterium]|nr:acyl-CoA dehydrogenase family protein [Betaproteobacteria bacterium]